MHLQANLATAGVNLTMETIYASNLQATAALLPYMLIVSVVATVLEHFHLRIKL